MRRYIFGLTVFLIINFQTALAGTYPEIQTYVNDLLNKSFAILKDDKKTLTQKMLESEHLMTPNLELDWMAKYSLGRNRKSLSPQQLTNFIDLYSRYVVKSYSNNVRNYHNQEVVITTVKKISDSDYVVKTKLTRPSQEPLQMDYLVRQTGNSFKVFDIVTEGISLINSHQAEFTNIISNQGFDALIAELTTKFNNLTLEQKK